MLPSISPVIEANPLSEMYGHDFPDRTYSSRKIPVYSGDSICTLEESRLSTTSGWLGAGGRLPSLADRLPYEVVGRAPDQSLRLAVLVARNTFIAVAASLGSVGFALPFCEAFPCRLNDLQAILPALDLGRHVHSTSFFSAASALRALLSNSVICARSSVSVSTMRWWLIAL